MVKEQSVDAIWDEEWLPVNFEKSSIRNVYYVSNYGRIKSFDKQKGKEKLLKGSTSRNGFKMLNIRFDDGTRGGKYVHKVVAELFLKRPSEDHEIVIHLDYNKMNNRSGNLKWVTKDEWKAHLLKNPNFQAARANQKHKLTEADVKMIKRMLARGKQKHKTIARKFGISVTQVKRIEKGENWKDVDAF
ncbi:MAG: NUMOD4 domain-containing protein [Bacteroidota bacterium]